MARYNKLGFVPDQIICEDYALPANSTPVALTNDVEIYSKKAGNLRVIVCASDTAVELASAATLEFRPYVAETVALLTSAPVILPGVFAKDATTTDVTWDSGELIMEFNVPRNLMPSTAKFMRIMAVVSGNESEDNIEAYLLVD